MTGFLIGFYLGLVVGIVLTVFLKSKKRETARAGDGE